MRKHFRQRGSVLLLALLIMTTVIVSSVGLSSLILSSLQQSRVIDNSVVAYYAAESAIEDALFGISQDDDGIPLSDAQTLGNGADWQRGVATAENALYTVLPEDDFIEVALYDPLQPITATDLATVRVWWTDECSGCTAIQASLVGWLPQQVAWDQDASTRTVRAAWSPSGLALPIASPFRLYRLRLRALFGDLKNVDIRVFNDADEPRDIPGRIRIDARGDFLDAQQRISVTLPQREPASGLIDFAIYSECSIVKGGPATCSDPTPSGP
jgi:Tfp pilus assembly protein PilX